MGYTTKFNIGDTVWFVEEETVYGNNCPCCSGRLPNSKVMKFHKTTVKEIFIGSGYNKPYEQYNLTYPRSLSACKLYATKNEAEESIKVWLY